MKLKEGDWVLWRPYLTGTGGYSRVAQVKYTTKNYVNVYFPGSPVGSMAVERKQLKKISVRRGLTLAAAVLLGVDE